VFSCTKCTFIVDESEPERNASLIRQHNMTHDHKSKKNVGEKRTRWVVQKCLRSQCNTL
jgi:hypothetical protein